MRITGIDPGTTRIGYATLERIGGEVKLLGAETIAVAPRRGAAERLALLERALAERLARDRPDAVAVEKIYFTRNAKTAMAVAEARGIILLTAHHLATSICEYAPLEVKLAVTGYGRSDKAQVRKAVRLNLPTAVLPPGDDAIDAIALALTAIYTNPLTHRKERSKPA